MPKKMLIFCATFPKSGWDIAVFLLKIIITRQQGSVKIKFCKSLMHRSVSYPYELVEIKDLLLGASELAADAAVNARLFIVEHIDVEVSHKARGAAII